MRLFAADALLPEGWAQNVMLEIASDGTLASVIPDSAAADAERAAGPVIPAMPNVHSHAFQRALAGRTGDPSPQRDDTFWTWRKAMYTFLDRIDADAFEAIAAQAFVEMAKAGYATLAEFHYVHHDPAGKPYADPAELAWRIVAAADAAGVGLTLLPVFYAHAGFGGTPATAGQRRFVHTPYTFAHLFDALKNGETKHGYVLGVAPHSLRAVTPEDLRQVVGFAPSSAPVHIHAAEQSREVEECYAWSRLRPVEWLLAQAVIDQRWCVIHATHMTGPETSRLAASGAVAGLAPTTEADLGDGTFPGEAYLKAGGRFGIGTDSNTCIDPFAELRQLEWSQRLRLRRRNVLARSSAVPVGTSLWLSATSGGARALGRNTGRLEAGARADFVVLDTNEPALVGHPPLSVIDAAIFGPARHPVRDVMSAGRFIVRDGRHEHEEAILSRYRATLARLSIPAR